MNEPAKKVYHFTRYQSQELHLDSSTESFFPAERYFATLTIDPYKQNDHHLVKACNVKNHEDIDSLSLEYQDQYVTITQDQIAKVRVKYLNTLSRGDSFEKLLKEKLPEGANVKEQMFNEDRNLIFVYYTFEKTTEETE